ncbi:DUF3262 family protein [Photobacterium leiognathi]|uniref:DUF3262 family protein n=1 Tax=Photobacterium leiognathi TaxID=553611 RepID=UPI00273884FD|nr:DUF3262 family protein [Photobacterium leiognathi]
MNAVNAAFEHGAGFTTHQFAMVIAVIGMIIVTGWAVWVMWSVFKGLKSGRTDKAALLVAMRRTAVIWLVLNYLLFTGVF